MTLKKLPPVIGQLPTGEFVIFNMQDTPLWEETFPSGPAALIALGRWAKEHPSEKITVQVMSSRP